MKSLRSCSSFRAVTAVAGLILVAFAASAGAFVSRSPQVAFATGSLQGYLNGKGESINVANDQLDGEVWSSSVSGTASFTLMIELSANAPANALGIYNISDPVPNLFQIFPAAASAGWYAVTSFGGGGLVVSLFTNTNILVGQTSYAGVNANGFGFYLQGPGGLLFSDDPRNAGGSPQELTFAGTGVNFGDWWQCFEDQPYAAATSDFDDAVLMLQSVVPVRNELATWGGVKNLYH